MATASAARSATGSSTDRLATDRRGTRASAASFSPKRIERVRSVSASGSRVPSSPEDADEQLELLQRPHRRQLLVGLDPDQATDRPVGGTVEEGDQRAEEAGDHAASAPARA